VNKAASTVNKLSAAVASAQRACIEADEAVAAAVAFESASNSAAGGGGKKKPKASNIDIAMARAKFFAESGREYLFEQMFGKCWPDDTAGGYTKKFSWEKGQAPYDAALNALSEASKAGNNKKTNTIFQAACIDTSTNATTPFDRDSCIERLARVAAMLNACQSTFSSRLTTARLKDGSGFTDANTILNAPKILADVLKRLVEIEAVSLEDDDDSSDATQ
jgi:hypothetical protein